VNWASATQLVTGSVDETVKIWTLTDDKISEAHVCKGHSFGIVSTAVNSTGTMAASSSLDSTIRFWDVASGKEVKKIDAGPVESWTVAFSPDGKSIISGTSSGCVNMWDVESGKKTLTLTKSRGAFAMSVAHSPNRRFIASGHADGAVCVTNDKEELVHKFTDHQMPVRTVAFSSDSQFLITGSDDKCILVYDISGGGELLHRFTGHTSWVLAVAPSPTAARIFATGSTDKSVKLWDIGAKECVHTFQAHKDQVWGLAWSPDGAKLASVGDDARLQLYSIRGTK